MKLRNLIHTVFMNKQTRDKIFKELPRNVKKHLRRSSIRNQLLHPQYVADYEQETGKTLTAQDKGLGNTIYKTYFPCLYSIKLKNPFLNKGYVNTMFGSLEIEV